MRHFSRRRNVPGVLLILSFFLLGAVSVAFAELQRVGPNNPAPSVGNFPAWYQDNTGLTLEFCDPLNQSEVDGGWCLLLPTDVTVTEVFPTNFFDEHFWYAADAGMTHAGTPGGANRVLLVLAVEAAFVADVVPGGQISFSRIRVRMDDVPVTGTYRFIHPYGEELIDGVAGERIFFTDDVGFTCPAGHFDCALQSRLGPFLLPSAVPGGAEMPALTALNPTPDTDPAHFGGTFTPTAYPGTGRSYIADPARIGPVTGSPTGNNRFRVEGPSGSNLGGPGIDFIETSDFTLVGRIFSSSIPGEVTVDRASYTRNGTGQKVDVYATAFETTLGRLPGQPVPAPVLPQLSFFDAPCTPSAVDNNLDPIPPFSAPAGGAETQMSNAGNNFWGQVEPLAIPAEVCVKDNVTLTYFPKKVVDEITITQAFFDPIAQTLSVNASSSDSIAPPTLTLGGFGDLAGGSIVVPSLAAAPANVRVLSSVGGTNEYQVTTSPPPPPSPPSPATGATLFASLASPQFTGASVTFIGVGSGGTGTYEYRFWLNSGGTWNVVQDYSTASTWTWNNPAAGSYQVAVWARSVGSILDQEAVSTTMPFVINSIPVQTDNVTFSASPAGSQIVGNPVFVTASAGGGSGSYEYRFWLFTGGVWTIVQDYTTAPTWTWTNPAVGSYQITVWARSVGSTADEAFGTAMSYTINPIPNPATGVTLSALPVDTQTAGQPVVFTGTGSGGTGTYEYRFWLNSGGVWTVVQDYSSSNQWTWTNPAAGSYQVSVWARSAGSTADSEATGTPMAYTVTP